MHLSVDKSYLFSLLRGCFDGVVTGDSVKQKTVKMDRAGWHNLYSVSAKHGVLALALESIPNAESFGQPELNFNSERDLSLKYGLLDTETNHPPFDLLTKWEIEVNDLKDNYYRQIEVLAGLTAIFEDSEITPVILNSIAIGHLYPNPSLRHYSDLDIYLGESFDRAIKILDKKGITVEVVNSSYSHFVFRGLKVRIHSEFLFYQFSGRLITKTDKKVNKQLKKLLKEGTEIVEADGNKFCVPNREFTLLYYIRYMTLHFTEFGLYLRNLVDLSFILAGIEHINHDRLSENLKKSHLYKLFSSFVLICRDNFGLKNKFSIIEDKMLSDKVVYDMFFNKYRKIEKQKLKKMGKLRRYILNLSYFFSVKWKYDKIKLGLFYKTIPKKLFP
jgi:hypothetical protein